MTFWEAKNGLKLNISYLRIFSSVIFNKVENRKKLDPKVKYSILVGFIPKYKIYQIYYFLKKVVIEARDVTIYKG